MADHPQRPERPRTRTLADLVDGCLDKASAAQGFAGADILLAWEDVVGERLARFSQPIRMEWPRRFQPDGEGAREAATLIVRVESAFALELQHTAPLVLERVNAHYGWRCVGRLVLKQGPVRPPRPAEPVRSEPPPETRRRMREATAAVADPVLRSALDRLASSVAATTACEGRG